MVGMSGDDHETHDFDWQWDIVETANYVATQQFTRVVLQFSDELLPIARRVYHRLLAVSQINGAALKLHLMADSTFGSRTVDEVSAAHVRADCIIHYGDATLGQPSKMPVFYVLPKQTAIEVKPIEEAVNSVRLKSGNEGIVVLLDFALFHLAGRLAARFEGSGAITVADVGPRSLDPFGTPQARKSAEAHTVSFTACAQANAVMSKKLTGASCDGMCTSLHVDNACMPPLVQRESSAMPVCCEGSKQHSLGRYMWSGNDNESVHYFWVGPLEKSCMALTELALTSSDALWSSYDPFTQVLRQGMPAFITRLLQRRYYVYQKLADAQLVGLLVGTLAVEGHKEVTYLLKQMAKFAGKKSYTMLMGKPSPVKLANFPEVEVWVHIADASSIILESKEYFAPVATPYEAGLAFSGRDWSEHDYCLDFQQLLPMLRTALISVQGAKEVNDHAIVERVDALSVNQQRRDLMISRTSKGLLAKSQPQNAVEFFKLKRSYQGLEAPCSGFAEKEAELVQEGRSGRPSGYNLDGSSVGSV